MRFIAEVWMVAVLATLASVTARPEQEIASPQQQDGQLSGSQIQVLPQDAAVRNSRAFTSREGNEASPTRKDENKDESSKQEDTKNEKMMVSENVFHEDTKEKKLEEINKGDEPKNVQRTLFDRSGTGRSEFKYPKESAQLEYEKQGILQAPWFVQLDNAHLGIEERNANKFRDFSSNDFYPNMQGVVDPEIDGLVKNSEGKLDELKESDGATPSEQDDIKVPEDKIQEKDSTRASNNEDFNEKQKTTSTNNKGYQYNPDNNAMQQLMFNPMLKDIFKYNPAFDYLSKVAAQQDRSSSYNAGSKFNHNSINGGRQNGQEPVIKRKIQYHQMVFQPNPSLPYMNPYFMKQQQAGFPHQSMFNYNPSLDHGAFNRYQDPGFNGLPQINTHQHQQVLENNGLRYPSMFNQMPHPYNLYQMRNSVPQRAYDEYFPVIIHNPFNMMWSAFTNIIEYGPEADVCRAGTKNMRKGRNISGSETALDEENIDINSDLRFEIPKRFGIGGPPPFIRRMKVRRGGVAIAGPGGIATAGSGGTAIVGPGGTAYTKEDGTAIVGPGGRLVHVSEFPPLNFFKQPMGEGRTFQDPPGSKLIAMGPVIYYSPKQSS